MRRLVLCLTLVIAVVLSAPAQVDHWRFINITEKDGVPDVNATSGAFDHLGRHWIGSSSGLYVYDGYTFSSFLNDPADSLSLPHNLIHNIGFLNQDSLLMATQVGLVIMDIRTHVFHLPGKNGSWSGVDLPERPWAMLIETPGSCWATSETGLYHIDFRQLTVKNWLAVPNPKNRWEGSYNQLGSVLQSPLDPDILWTCGISTPMSFHKKTEEFRFYPEDPSFNNDDVQEMATRFPSVSEMLVDHEGGLWMATMGHGIKYAPPGGGPWKNFRLSNETSTLDAHNILPDLCLLDKSTILVASRSLGLASFDISNQTFTYFEHDPSSPNSILPLGTSAIERDPDGRTWAMMFSGISYHDPKTDLFQRHPSSLGRWPYFSTIDYDHANQILVGGKVSGVYGYDNQNKEVILPDGIYETENPVPFPGVTSVLIRKNGDVWVGGSDVSKRGPPGIYQFHWDEKRVELLISKETVDDFPLHNINTLFEDRQERVWVGGPYLHPVCFDDGRVITLDSIEVAELWDFDEDKEGGIWAAEINGPVRIVLDEMDYTFFRPCEGRPCADLVRSTEAIAVDQHNNVWAGTRYHGLVKFSGDKWDEVLNLSTNIGLPTSHITAIQKQGDFLWIGTVSGLVRLHTETHDLNVFSAKDGLADAMIEGLHFDGDHTLYIGTRRGLHYADLDSLEKRINASPPNIYFVDFNVNGAKDTDGITGDNMNGYTLSYPLNSFQVEYAGVDLTHPEDNVYAYFLEGNDTEWIQAGNRRFTAYNNLDPGQYTLRVKSANNHGFWTENGAALPIHIKPAYWQTTWFKVLMGFLATALLYAAYRFRIHQVQRESRLVLEFNKKIADAESQALRAQMNPHFIFNALNSIKLFVLNRSPEKGGVYLDAFARLVRSVLQNSKEPLISLEKELDALDLYIGLEKLRFDEAFDHEIRIAEDLDADFYLVPPLILQPYVENAIWHGLMPATHKGRLVIDARLENEKLLIEIEDNGVGRKKSAELKMTDTPYKKSMGMEITRDRMELQKELVGLDIHVDILDLVGNDGSSLGTRVALEVGYG